MHVIALSRQRVSPLPTNVTLESSGRIVGRLLTFVSGFAILWAMFEATITEFPFVEALPKREKGKLAKLWDRFAELRQLTEEKGMLIPQHFAAELLGVSRQRVHTLVNEGRLEAVEVGGSRFVTEPSVLAYAEADRSCAVRLKSLTNKDLWRIAMSNARGQVKSKKG